MKDMYENYTLDYEQLTNFELSPSEKPFILTVNKQGVPFEFLIRVQSNSDKAIVLGSGAYDAQSELKPPIFQRHKWMKHFDENLIYYNDPTLYLGQINLGWGFGHEERHYLPEVAEILEVILDKAAIRREKTLFYGSSAGGFMSLMLSGLLKNTKALVNNPQTIVWNYYDRHVNNMFSHAYPDLSREEIIEKYSNRLNILDFYKSIQYVPELIYLQNTASRRDLTHHMNPFILGLNDFNDDDFASEVDFKLYSDEETGHSPLKLQDSVQQIKDALAKL